MDTMDGFDTMTMSYLGNPMPVGLLPHTEYLQPGMDLQDQISTFDTETYMRFVAPSCWMIGSQMLNIL
jgi:hypothetical protein